MFFHWCNSFGKSIIQLMVENNCLPSSQALSQGSHKETSLGKVVLLPEKNISICSWTMKKKQHPQTS